MEKENNFKPAWWLRQAHLQTLWPALLRRPIKNLILKRERIELPDGDFIDLDWTEGSGPIVLILHGLEGSLQSSYAKGMLLALKKHHYRGVFMNFRGCSGEVNRFPHAYHSGETSDLNIVIQRLHAREPHTPLAAVGFSLGGNVLLKWLGETKHDNLLSAAVAISVPFELFKCIERVNRGFSRIYQWHLLHCLQRKMQLKSVNTSQFQTLREFDNHITAPLHGFKDAEDYYFRCSSRQFLPNIVVPTLLLQAKDDPFMTEDVVPTVNELPPAVQLEVSEYGGHVGFVGGSLPWRPQYWLESRVPQFLQGYL
ncbi:MAG TPA: hydrolase [Gammaproteobacteria bacterium]|jgi:hypothetical protein|nr:hydrolase [Gammaproteobacteria bacterium]